MKSPIHRPVMSGRCFRLLLAASHYYETKASLRLTISMQHLVAWIMEPA